MAKASPNRAASTRSGPRPIRAITAEYLNNVALYYLGRYAATEHSLRQVLHRRLRRNQALKDTAALALVEATIQKARDLHLFNDAQFAQSKTQSLNRAGKSRRVIMGKLQQKGVAPALIAAAWETQAASGDDPEYAAALRFAQRKKLGPYGQAGRVDYKKQIQQFARAGFSYALAKQVLQIPKGEDDDDHTAGSALD
jgi:regulatory protein